MSSRNSSIKYLAHGATVQLNKDCTAFRATDGKVAETYVLATPVDPNILNRAFDATMRECPRKYRWDGLVLYLGFISLIAAVATGLSVIHWIASLVGSAVVLFLAATFVIVIRTGVYRPSAADVVRNINKMLPGKKTRKIQMTQGEFESLDERDAFALYYPIYASHAEGACK